MKEEAFLDQITRSQTENAAVLGNKEDEILRIWDCGSPLYDVHELVTVSFIIEKHRMILPGGSDSKRFKTGQAALFRGPVYKVAKVVGSEIIDGCGAGAGGGWRLARKWRVLKGKCSKRVLSNYKIKNSFARLIRF